MTITRYLIISVMSHDIIKLTSTVKVPLPERRFTPWNSDFDLSSYCFIGGLYKSDVIHSFIDLEARVSIINVVTVCLQQIVSDSVSTLQVSDSSQSTCSMSRLVSSTSSGLSEHYIYIS
jgi:hypothetical protein